MAARERILETAYDLFAHNGIRAVGIGQIVEEAGVAKMSLYNSFASKEQLVLAFLDLREQRWTRGWLEAAIDDGDEVPATRPLALFDALDDWFHEDDFERCPFINTLLEVHDPSDPVAQAAVSHLETVRATIEERVAEAGIASPEKVAAQLQLLMMGAIVAASAGDLDAARRARELAELLLDGAS
jgi:AcrR family transcriptional regulator